MGGVSWYEAAAYAEFAGKALPTISHWYRAADPNTSLYVLPLSNFSRVGPAPVGKYQGISVQGAYDLAGNVREWCWNEAGHGLRYIMGGAWDGPAYQFTDPDARSPWDRGQGNGFRCVKYTAPVPAEAFALKERGFRDFSKETPVSDAIFALFRSAYAYDKTDPHGTTDQVDLEFPVVAPGEGFVYGSAARKENNRLPLSSQGSQATLSDRGVLPVGCCARLHLKRAPGG